MIPFWSIKIPLMEGGMEGAAARTEGSTASLLPVKVKYC